MGRTQFTGLIAGGAILVLLGVMGFAMPMFTTHQTREVAKIGDLKLEATENRSYLIPPLLSGGALALGVVLIGAGIVRRA